MVCATSNLPMNKRQEDEEDEFDMAMDEDEDSEEESSQDETPPKRPVTQALFLNFTSDLSPQKANKKKSKPKKQTAYRVNGVNILNRYILGHSLPPFFRHLFFTNLLCLETTWIAKLLLSEFNVVEKTIIM